MGITIRTAHKTLPSTLPRPSAILTHCSGRGNMVKALALAETFEKNFAGEVGNPQPAQPYRFPRRANPLRLDFSAREIILTSCPMARVT